MSLTINSNILSLHTQRNLGKSTGMLGTVFERLSSGLRINHAKDDSAGFSISTRMESKIREHNQAIRNVNDGISMLQVAEGGMRDAINIMQRMREMAVQAANDTYSSSDRGNLQTELDQLKMQLSSIASNTEFNDQKILDGTLIDKKIMTGNSKIDIANDSQLFNLKSLISSDYLVNYDSMDGDQSIPVVKPMNNGGFVIVWSDENINGLSAQTFNSSGKEVGNRISIPNSWKSWSRDPITVLNDDSFVVLWRNGDNNLHASRFDSDGNKIGLDFQVNQATTLNAGGEATITSMNNGGFAISYMSDSNRNIHMQIFDSNSNKIGGEILISEQPDYSFAPWKTTIDELSSENILVTWSEIDGSTDKTRIHAQILQSSGIKVGNTKTLFEENGFSIGDVHSVSPTDDGGFIVARTNGEDEEVYVDRFNDSMVEVWSNIKVNSEEVSGKSTSVRVPTIDKLDNGNFLVSYYASVSTYDLNIYTQEIDISGNKVGDENIIKEEKNVADAEQSIAVINGGGYIISWSSNSLSTQEFFNNREIFSVRYDENGNKISFSDTSIDIISLKTQKQSNNAISTIENALNSSFDMVAEVGSLINRLESISYNLIHSTEDLTAARSRIMDADIAQETANLTTASIIQQAGIAILAQANQQPQIALQLLG